MKRYIPKILIIAVILMFSVVSNCNYSRAVSLSEIITGGEQFLKKGESNRDELFDADKEQEAVDQVYYILLGIAIIAAFVVGAVLGIQFITSGAAGQAKVKEKLIPYVVGLFVVFGAFGIWKIALNLGRTLLEAPPAYLASTDEASITITSASSSDRKNKIGYSGNREDVTVKERQQIGIYVVNGDAVDLPVARGRIKLNVSGKMDKSSDTDRWVGVGPMDGQSSVNIDTASITGKNGYKAWYDSSTNEIVFEYSDLNNVPNLVTGAQLFCFDISISEGFRLPDDSMPEFKIKDTDTTMGYGTYNVDITSMKFYDKENNDITRNVNCKESKYELKIKYWIDTDSWGEVWRDGWFW